MILREKLADFHLDEVEELFVVDEVNFVEPDHDLWHADLAGKEDVLAGLRHRAVSGRDDEDGAVHLRGTRDHVLHEVGVAGAINVRIVALFGLILNVSDRDRDDLGSVADGAAFSDVRVSLYLSEAFAGLDGKDCGRRGGFAVVDVADGANVDVRFRAFECAFSHGRRVFGFG